MTIIRYAPVICDVVVFHAIHECIRMFACNKNAKNIVESIDDMRKRKKEEKNETTTLTHKV